ncbi:MAG: two pore domain potassium channel family protein [Deltaproteobacteria bacterium]|nr:two pore domain potassium channel family protein [Deltaproteobacteria bacterium]
MLINIVVAAVLMVITTVIHTGAMSLTHVILNRFKKKHSKYRLLNSNVRRIGIIVILMFYISLAEVLLWASAYLLLNAIEGFEKAFYFSMVTFTTLGYGEIVLGERWRLLASFEAANGIIMFGWSTAIVIFAVQHVYARKDGDI